MDEYVSELYTIHLIFLFFKAVFYQEKVSINSASGRRFLHDSAGATVKIEKYVCRKEFVP